MNFRENYQREMNEIEKPSDITEKVLNAIDMEQGEYAGGRNSNIPKRGTTWKTAAAAIAILCVLGLCLQHEKVISFAQSVFNRFTLSVNNEDIEFGDLKPVNMDIDAFINDAETELGPGPDINYDHRFTTYQEMNQLTQLEFPCADKVKYKNIWVDFFPEYKNGHIVAHILYQGVSYDINGMFTVDGFDQEEWGYGAKGTKEVYQYGDGKIACFVKYPDGDKKVYFQEKNILFQMNVDNGDDIESGAATASKEQTKKLLDLFGQESEK